MIHVLQRKMAFEFSLPISVIPSDGFYRINGPARTSQDTVKETAVPIGRTL